MHILNCTRCGRPVAHADVPVMPDTTRFTVEKVLAAVGMRDALKLLNDPAALADTFAMRHPECE